VAVDLDNRVTHWNREAEQLYGWSAAEVIGNTSATIGVEPTDRSQADEIARRILAGQSWTGEFPVMTKSGAYKRMHFHAGPVRDDGGTVIGLVSVANDADEMAETAAQLSLFQSALGQSPVGVGAASLVSDVDEQHRIRERLRDATERLALLAQVSELLASSLDLERTLGALARLVVPVLADHCVVDLIDDNDVLRRQTVVHAE